MADWYVYQHDDDPLGPWSTDTVADAILVGKLAPDVWVAAPGGPKWLRALDVPVIGQRVEGVPTRPRRDSGLRLIPSASALEAAARAAACSAMRRVDEEAARFEVAEAALPTAEDTAKHPAGTFAVDEPDEATDRTLPPCVSSSSSPPLTLASDDALGPPSTERHRRRRNA